VVFCYCTGVAPVAFRPSLEGVPVVLDMVDVDSVKWKALAPHAWPPLSWVYAREARVLATYEAWAARRAAVTLVVNERERKALAALAPDARLEIVENGVDLDGLRRPDGVGREPVVVFVGVMDYAPNVQGAVWLARDVWPLVRERRPDARLEIVGAHPARAVRALHDPGGGIIVTGAVPDVRPFLWKASVAAAPIHTSRGIQNKVLEAIAAGLPVVVTPAVMEGLPAEVRGASRSGPTPVDFAAGLVEGLQGALDPGPVHLESVAWSRRLAGLGGLIRSTNP
jgi:glycosyltransferase involved in cell wall biosynthesis